MFPVIFVSLGPGEPELITVKGLKALQTADCIFCPETLANCLVYHVILALAFEILISSSSTKSVYIPCEIRLFLKSIRLLITTLRSSAVR